MWIAVCLVIALRKGAEGINVVNNECSVEMCVGSPPVGLTDGNVVNLAHTVTALCTESDITITLQGYYFIHYVVLFGGESMKDEIIKFGGKFAVLGSESPHCGINLVGVSEQALRVNCEFQSIPQNQFRIRFEVEPFYVAEIEAHTLFSEKANEDPMIYRGCSKDFPLETKTPFTNLKSCRSFCKNYSYMAVKAFSKLCACGKTSGDFTSEEFCNLKCPNSSYKCGGVEAFAVYLVKLQLPYYKECRSIEKFEWSLYPIQPLAEMSPTSCIRSCDKYLFALLYNGDTCMCSNDLYDGSFSFEDTENCSLKCKEDTSSFCGGPKFFSVYATCLNKKLGTETCLKLLRYCPQWNKFGACDRVCDDGYIGEHCIERVGFKIESMALCNESSPCLDIPNSVCKLNERLKIFECVCQPGFLETHGNLCEDIDECLYEPCNNVTSSCANVLGSYLCPCRPGYKQLTDIICKEDITDDTSYTSNLMFYMFLLFIHISFIVIYCCIGSRIDKVTGSELSTKNDVEIRPSTTRTGSAGPPGRLRKSINLRFSKKGMPS